MDYRTLLKKYMSEILTQEGISYIEFPATEFTPEETLELTRIQDEIISERKPK